MFLICAPGATREAQTLIAEIRDSAPNAALVLATEGGSPEDVLELLKLNIHDFVTSPFTAVDILPRLWRLLGHRHMPYTPPQRLKFSAGFDNLIGVSARFQEVVEKLPLFAKCDATILISGETGTGKEICSRAIHDHSARANGPFVPVNCGAIPAELVENELFGHERAAFTSATSSHLGLIHEAEGGTLFLDEIDSLPPTSQVKLLRFLQEKEYKPLGSNRTHSADVRLIAASNTDLEDAVRQGRLRQDFYFRLNVLPLTLPPLRERLSDIPLLARRFLSTFATKLHRCVPLLLPKAESALMNYSWPGNVRELEHVIERAAILAEARGEISEQEIILPGANTAQPSSFQHAKARVLAEFERSYIESLLLTYHGNISHAARAAGKNRRAFWQLMRKHQIDANRFRVAAPDTSN
ncbi:Helix-turn-helix, Fis-type [Nitrococcus mobilis Nb-231]|uniref:Helix-turn-helix, Fis-type n=2 Tax=Nitrococcus mobilis TaxID=35797 RepID=A4BQY1_9GAMM|nr:Helix-turn-helix, Fis-type [Nitrococcus mobilis Nb-231]